MKIGIVSDTHMFRKSKALPKALVQGLYGVDLILHAGDWTDPLVVDLFRSIAPIEGVAGNNDGSEILKQFGTRKILHLQNVSVGLIHGHEGSGATTPDKAFRAFRQEPVDLIVFGHSHIPYSENRDGIWLFNPGSPTDKRRHPLYSFGILTLQPAFEIRHVFFESKE